MDEEEPPPGATQFYMLNSKENPEEVITFGFFDGTMEEMRKRMAESGYDEKYAKQLEQIAPFVESVGTDGVYEVVEDMKI
jgi:hypothetical protein